MQTAHPLIYTQPNSPASPPTPGGIKAFIRKHPGKTIFGILGLLLLVELLFGARYLLQSERESPSASPKITSMSAGSVVVSAPKKVFKKAEVIPVTVRVVTGGRMTASADVVLKYDPAVLEASTAGSVKEGDIYEEFPVAQAYPDLGQIHISGITLEEESSFSGIGVLATVNFKAKKEGSTKISVDFKPGETNESNIVLSNSTEDILSQVFDADIIISDSQTTMSHENPKSCSGYTQFCQMPDGKTGRQNCSLGKLEAKECKFDPNLTVSCEPCLTN